MEGKGDAFGCIIKRRAERRKCHIREPKNGQHQMLNAMINWKWRSKELAANGTMKSYTSDTVRRKAQHKSVLLNE